MCHAGYGVYTIYGITKAVLDDGISRKRAAVLHGVPRSTLKDRLSGRVIHGQEPGPQPTWMVQEEKLVN